jgi:hypothetical protein
MREIADTLASVGVPAGFPKAAGEIYEKLRACKGAGQPEIAEILRKLRE